MPDTQNQLRHIRVILIQLPVPDPNGRAARANIPLSAAWLQSAWKQHVQASTIHDPVEFIQAPADLIDHGGDQKILSWIIKQQPDLVGFSLYLWNRERAEWLANKLHTALPLLTTIAGGPEVQTSRLPAVDSPDLPAFTWLVEGEGEIPFITLLSGLCRTTSTIAYQSPFGLRPDAISTALHPCLDLTLPPQAGRPVFLETVRGCPYTCSYCYYGKQSGTLRWLPEIQVEAIVRAAADAGVRDLYLMDPSFTKRPRLDDFLTKLAAWNTRGMQIHTELRLEDINPARAEALFQAGVRSVEAGLQSTNPRALQSIKRSWDRPRFEAGAQALQNAGIRISTGIIFGLPEDGPDEIQATIDYVAEQGLAERAEAYPLAVLTGTELRKQAATLGLEWMQEPPWYIQSTPWLSADELGDSLNYAAECWGRDSQEPVRPAMNASIGKNATEILDTLAQPETLDACIAIIMRKTWFTDRKAATGTALFDAGRRFIQQAPFTHCHIVWTCDTVADIPNQKLLRDAAHAFTAPNSFYDRLRSFEADDQESHSCRSFVACTSVEAAIAWDASSSVSQAELILDCSDMASEQKSRELLQLAAEYDWQQLPFLRLPEGTTLSDYPGLATIWDGLDNLII